MILKTIVAFLVAQLSSLYLVHKLTYRGEIEYSILVNVFIIGALAFFWPQYMRLNTKSIPTKKILRNETLKIVLGVSIAFLIDYFVWLLNYEPRLRSLEWKNGVLVAALYFTVSIVTLLVSLYTGYTLVIRKSKRS